MGRVKEDRSWGVSKRIVHGACQRGSFMGRVKEDRAWGVSKRIVHGAC